MLIKHAGLEFQPTPKRPALYLLLAADAFQQDKFAKSIIQSWRKDYPEGELKTWQLNTTSDWHQLADEAKSYSLFSSQQFINVYYPKKTIDAAAKTFIDECVKDTTGDCTILIQAPNLTLKHVQPFANKENLQVIWATLPDSRQIKKWIKDKIDALSIRYDEQVVDLIYQCTEGNLLACSQLLEKLNLISDNQYLSLEQLHDHVSDQCEYQLFELAELCLQGKQQKALQVLRYAMVNKNELTLILWILAQEIRHLLQLHELLGKNIPFRDACTQLKIWSTKVSTYQAAIKKYDKKLLAQWLNYCSLLDKRIKTNHSEQLNYALELLTLSLCTGKQVGHFA